MKCRDRRRDKREAFGFATEVKHETWNTVSLSFSHYEGLAITCSTVASALLMNPQSFSQLVKIPFHPGFCARSHEAQVNALNNHHQAAGTLEGSAAGTRRLSGRCGDNCREAFAVESDRQPPSCPTLKGP